MSSQGLFSIGGISSGLDTNAIIDQLLQLERQPIKRIERQRDLLDVTRGAWGQVTTKLSGLRAAVDHTLRADRLTQLATAESSNPTAVQATATGQPEPGTHTFSVERLARADQHASDDTFASLDEEFGDRGIEVTVGDVTWNLTDGIDATTPLSEVVAAINEKGAPVTAEAVQTEPGVYRLVLTADETGSQGAFTVATSGADWVGGIAEVQSAQDALIKVGGVEVTRSSNTIDDLIDGVELTLNSTTDSVTVTTGQDTDAAVQSVTELVDALNAVITTVGELTDYDTETNKAGPLQGQFAANDIVTSLRSAFSNPVDGIDGSDGIASSFGISLTRDGMFEVDEAVLRGKVADDLESVGRLFSRAASTTDEAAIYASSTSETVAGTYAVEVTQAAQRAAITQANPYAAPATPTTIRISQANGDTAEVTLDDVDHADAGAAAAAINSALSEAGMSVLAAEVVDGSLQISHERYGDGYAFTVEELDGPGGTPNGGTALDLAGEHVGVDVAGTIGGAAATGSGRLLRSIEGGATGLSLQVDGAADFDVTYSAGISGALDAQLGKVEGTNGTVARAQTSLENQMRMYDDRIESFEHRVEQREITLRRQFVGLETALAELNDQGAWLSQQLSGLNAQLGRS